MSKTWLIIQANLTFGPYGDTNCEFLRECYSLQNAIQRNGNIADIWGLRHKNYLNKPNFNNYDYIFMEEQYEFDWIPWEDIGNSKAIKLQLCGDIHVHKSYYNWTNLFDIILHPYKEALYEGKKLFPNKKHIWFPSAADDRYYFIKNDVKKIYDIIWMGSPTRKYVQELKKDVGLIQMLKSGQEYINTLHSTKIMLNSRSEKDINYKMFEGSLVGICCITDYDELYEELGFIDDINCYFYRDYEECLYKIKKALSNNNWKRIGISGSELAKNHSYYERIKRLKRILNNEIEGINYAT